MTLLRKYWSLNAPHHFKVTLSPSPSPFVKGKGIRLRRIRRGLNALLNTCLCASVVPICHKLYHVFARGASPEAIIHGGTTATTKNEKGDTVIPAQAGIHPKQRVDPCFRRGDGIVHIIKSWIFFPPVKPIFEAIWGWGLARSSGQGPSVEGWHSTRDQTRDFTDQSDWTILSFRVSTDNDGWSALPPEIAQKSIFIVCGAGDNRHDD